MALSKQLIAENGRIDGSYHRIQSVTDDFDLSQRHIVIISYADKSYRDLEKKEIAQRKKLLARYRELEAKQSRTMEEELEFQRMNPQELEKTDFTPHHISTARFTLPIDHDIRESVYHSLVSLVPSLEGALEV